MGERVAFATSNWKDRPFKGARLVSDGEWDSEISSKFNGFVNARAPAEAYTPLLYLPSSQGGTGIPDELHAPAEVDGYKSPFIKIPIEKAIKWAWRVKKWKISINFEYAWWNEASTDEDGNCFGLTPGGVTDDSVNMEFEAIDSANNESEKITSVVNTPPYGPSSPGFVFKEENNMDGEQAPGTGFSFSFQLLNPLNSNSVWINYPNYSSPFFRNRTPVLRFPENDNNNVFASHRFSFTRRIYSSLGENDYNQISVSSVNSWFPENLIPPNNSLSATIDGEPLFIFFNFERLGGNETSCLEKNPVGSITIDPVEYWEYATSQGEPVYDKTTGAELKDPLS
jgi:hypothetical protein